MPSPKEAFLAILVVTPISKFFAANFFVELRSVTGFALGGWSSHHRWLAPFTRIFPVVWLALLLWASPKVWLARWAWNSPMLWLARPLWITLNLWLAHLHC